MKISIYQVDAFSRRVFGGNPAAVVILDEWLPDERLQAIAMENNLSETAYLVGSGNEYELRWFTPAVEVDLCGHATLASAHVLFEHGYASDPEIVFHYQGGLLKVRREGELLAMTFPARPPEPAAADEILAAALGHSPVEVLRSRDILAVYDSESQVRALRPDFTALACLDTLGVIASAPGDDCDFVSRFFAPRAGVNEDPVTGSAHCTLIPYWSRRLEKAELHARQVSSRGGELFCVDQGETVQIAGYAVEYLQGSISI